MTRRDATENALLSFADRLIQQIRRRGTPVLVGLDPRWEQLPPVLTSGGEADSTRRAAAYARFCREVIDVVAPLVPAVKPQAAFFEQLGPAGMAALHEVIQYARAAGLLVILDGKRNDIGSTAEAYAEGYLIGGQRHAESEGSAGARGILHCAQNDNGPWGADALTVSPYLGEDSLRPFVEVCQRRGAGIFVLVKTSNPGGGQFQDLVVDGRPLYRHVGDFVERLAVETIENSRQSSRHAPHAVTHQPKASLHVDESLRDSNSRLGETGPRDAQGYGTRGVPTTLYGAVGAVVGATYPQQLAELRTAMPHTWFLVPGFGAQGGAARDVAPAFDAQGLGAIVNNSRGIIFAHARKEYAQRFAASDWQRAVEAATREMIEQLRAETPAGRLTEASKTGE